LISLSPPNDSVDRSRLSDGLADKIENCKWQLGFAQLVGGQQMLGHTGQFRELGLRE
jgi:hypothetical protein